jgi:hypothetical protein
MNDNFLEIISASAGDRRDLWLTTATRLGTTEQNVEKDFWICWVLDALFHGLPPHGPRLLFKGGTSLSKAFGLISRFSEDIDITVFRADLDRHSEERFKLGAGVPLRVRGGTFTWNPQTKVLILHASAREVLIELRPAAK